MFLYTNHNIDNCYSIQRVNFLKNLHNKLVMVSVDFSLLFFTISTIIAQGDNI